MVGPVVCPPQPTGLTAAAQDSGALVSWDDVRAVVEGELAALAEDGVQDLPAAADVVTDIQVTVTAVADASDEQVVTVAGDATQARVSGLRNGVEYTVRVIALGEFGAGPVSEPIAFSPTTGVEGEIGGVLIKRDDAAKAAPASQSASNVDGVAVTDDGQALDGVDKIALSEAVDVAEGEAIARTIEAQPEVQWAEPDLVVLPAAVPASTDGSGTDSRSGWNISGEYGVGQVTDPDAGAGVTVAVIDTGITTHPDLDERLVAGFDFVSNPEVLAAPRSEGGQPVPFDGDYADEATYGALGRDADPTDPGDWRGVAPIRDSTWHGTHTAGVIADVVPAAKIQPIRALSWRGGLLSDVAAGITWASGGTVDGAPANATPSKVINLSFSVQAPCPNTLQTAIDDAVARGSVVVAAAGNNNADASGYAPGNCANVITVGATNADGKRATYSNYGTLVDASAPGATPRIDREGTSIAAAHTAAALALIAAQQPGLTPDQLAAELTGTYLRAFPAQTCDLETDKLCGLGLVRIATGTIRTVTSTADTVDATDGVLTLREAITEANSSSGDTINFSLPSTSTITLTASLPQITRPMTISGPGEDQLTIDANGVTQLFFINGADTTVQDLSLTGASLDYAHQGALIHNTKATSVIRRVTMFNNSASVLVYNKEGGSELLIDDCTFQGNSAEGNTYWRFLVVGNHGDTTPPAANTVVIRDSTFIDNSDYIYMIDGARSFDIQNSTFQRNSARLYTVSFRGAGNYKFINNTVSDNSSVAGEVKVAPSAQGWGEIEVRDNTFTGNIGPGLTATSTEDDPVTIAGNTFGCDTTALLFNGSWTVPDSITQANTFTCDSLGSGDGGSSSSGGSSGGSTTPGPTSPPGVTTPPPRTSLPIGAVLGSGLMLVGGELVPVAPQRAPSGGKWTVSGNDFSLEFVPQATDSGLYEGPAQTLRAPVGGQVQVTGDGYLGGSSVSVYLVPPSASGVSARASMEPVYLGDATVAADGDFAVTFSVPASVDPGDYVLQINGWSQQASARSVNLNMGVYESLVARNVTEGAFFQGRSSEFSSNGQRKLRTLVTELPKVRQDVRVEITAVSVSLDDVESDRRLAARRGLELRDYLSESGVQGTYSVTIRTEDQLRSAERTPPLMMSSNGKPLTTVRITYDTSH